MRPHVAVITGPARSGKTWQLLSEYRAALKQGHQRAGSSSTPAGVADHPARLSPHAALRHPHFRALWIAPTARAAVAIRQSLLADGLVACLNPGVMTFEEIGERILAAAGATRNIVSPALQRELLRRVVQHAQGQGALKHYAEAAHRPSFIDLVVEAIRELKRRGIGPAELVGVVAPGRDADGHGELARMYFDYEALLTMHGLVDAEGRHWAARDALRSGTSGWPPALQLLVVDGFSDFTANQLQILKNLADRAEFVRISLPNDGKPTGQPESEHAKDGTKSARRTDLFAKSAATLSALRGVFANLDVNQLPSRSTAWPAMDHLSSHLFRNPNEIPKLKPGSTERGAGEKTNSELGLERFEIVEAAGEHDEIVQLARRIKQRLLPSPCPLPEGEGSRVRPGDIVVVFRTLAEAAPRVREVFTEFGIPFALESGAPLVRAPVLRTLMALLRLDAEDFPFRRVVGVLTNNSLSAFDGHARTQAEWLVRELQVARKRDALLGQIADLAADAANRRLSTESTSVEPAQSDHFERRAQAAFVALPLLDRLAKSLDALPNEATLDEWSSALERFGGELGLAPFASASPAADPTSSIQHPASKTDPESVLETVNELGAAPPQESAILAGILDGVAWQTIVGHFRSFYQLDERLGRPPRQCTRDDLLTLLVDLATHEKLPPPHDEIGRVRVLSATTGRTISAKHLYLAGMSEQAFPSPERAGRLYSDGDYRYFASKGAGSADDAASDEIAGFISHGQARATDEMLLFYEVLTRATETLTISYPALDAKAQVLPPSPYVTEIERTLGDENPVRRRAPHLSPVPPEPSPYSIGEWRVQAVAQALRKEEANLAPLAGLVADANTKKVAAAIDAGLRTIHFRSRRDRFSMFEGLLESPALRARLADRFGAAHLWSPSQWEKYAVCPFRFFLESVLGLEPLGELALATDHARRGSLLHRVMATFHRELRAAIGPEGTLPVGEREPLRKRFSETLQNAVRSVTASGVDAALLELDRRQIDKWGERYFAQLEEYNANWLNFTRPLTPAHFEVRFGPPRGADKEEDPRSTDVPLVLDLGGELVRITGRIDRIDVGRVGERIVFNIIDYKSGKRPSFSREKVESGQQLQPALYVMAAEAVVFANDGATPMYAGFWSMRNGMPVNGRSSLKCSVDGLTLTDDWPAMRQAVEGRIRQFVSDIRRGDFPVHSCDDQCTSRCDFNTICRISQVRSLDKVWPDKDGTPEA